MKYILRSINKMPFIFVNNKLFIKNADNKFIRIKQKIPEFIDDIEDLKKYDVKIK
tara:strand:- start:50 stop:214 length:165 start_codon:yes stop_codon:yes gene_type:complete